MLLAVLCVAAMLLAPVVAGAAEPTRAATPIDVPRGASVAPAVPTARATGVPDPMAAPPRLVEASGRAGEVALDRLAAVPDGSVPARVTCGEHDGVELCLRRREAIGDAPEPTASAPVATAGAPGAAGAPGPGPVSAPGAEASASAAVGSTVLEHRAAVCEGTGSDGFRVQPVYAHTGVAPDPAAIQVISDALGNVEGAFADSAARTGAERAPRWVTDDGGAGCRVVLRTARITTGATSFDALMEDLESQGVVPAVALGTVKHLVWTEGEILEPAEPGGTRTSTCGLGESYTDESPLGDGSANLNLYGTRAAIDDRCWDINGGGSVPAHELMHTLGAVQQGAPNYANDGHCDDEYDLMCYGPGMRLVCPDASDDALFDCGHDDYFDPDPVVGEYLCDHWNTSDSAYLQGWDTALAPRAVTGLAAVPGAGTVTVSHQGTPSCYGADFYRVEVVGVASTDTTSTSVTLSVPVGTHTVRVRPHSPYGDVFGEAVTVTVTVTRAATTTTTTPPTPNRRPVGSMVLSLTDGRGYGMLAWAVDPDSRTVPRMRVVIPGVVSREYGWNYRWADMPERTGWDRTEALVFLANLPPGTHEVCFDARDVNTGGWYRLDCRTHTVK